MSSIDLLKPFTLKIWIKSDLETLRNGWLDSTEITKWFLHKSSYFDTSGDVVDLAEVGGTYRWEWIEGTVDSSRVVAIEKDRLEFGWFEGKGGIEIRFTPSGSETLVELKQWIDDGTEDERAECQHDCKLGWTFFLINLKSVYEGGLDLRETDPARVPVVNY